MASRSVSYGRQAIGEGCPPKRGPANGTREGGRRLKILPIGRSVCQAETATWRLEPFGNRSESPNVGLGNVVARLVREVPAAKRIVYVLKNTDIPPRYYTGLTSNVAARLMFHNRGLCLHTATALPWCIDVVVEFADESRAVAFEKYLKSGSGVAFSKRHLRSLTDHSLWLFRNRLALVADDSRYARTES